MQREIPRADFNSLMSNVRDPKNWRGNGEAGGVPKLRFNGSICIADAKEAAAVLRTSGLPSASSALTGSSLQIADRVHNPNAPAMLQVSLPDLKKLEGALTVAESTD